MQRAARAAVSYSVPSVARHTQSSTGASIGRRTSSFTTFAPSGLAAEPRRDTVPLQTITWSSPSGACFPASTNHDTLTAAFGAWRTHPFGVRCCSTDPRSLSSRLRTRSGASWSNRAVTARCTMFFSFALREAVHGARGLFGWSICRGSESMGQTDAKGVRTIISEKDTSKPTRTDGDSLTFCEKTRNRLERGLPSGSFRPR